MAVAYELEGLAAEQGERPATAEMHLHAVEDVVGTMQSRYHTPLSLDDLASVACLSPFYFSRVFRAWTGLPPGRFLAAVRMEAAKRLLLTTDVRVTDVCLGVGYRSLGTFTSQFGQLVGISPRTLRRRTEAGQLSLPPLDGNVDAAVRGTVRLREVDRRNRLIFVGLFRTPAAQGRPAACALLTAPGAFTLPLAPSGSYHIAAAAFPLSFEPLDYLLPDWSDLFVAITRHPVRVWAGSTVWADLELRPMRRTDPPILAALPVLSEPAA